MVKFYTPNEFLPPKVMIGNGQKLVNPLLRQLVQVSAVQPSFRRG